MILKFDGAILTYLLNLGKPTNRTLKAANIQLLKT